MNVILNGEVRELPENSSLQQLLAHFSLPSQRIAIELNKSVVRRKEWADVRLNEDDRIEVIHFVGGG
jgi:sulfur carrier protein